MELGYLTARGDPVVIDTIGLRTIFPAYRVDERALTCEFLGHPEPLKPISDVRLSVALHRQGRGSPGEPFVRPVEARLYRQVPLRGRGRGRGGRRRGGTRGRSRG